LRNPGGTPRHAAPRPRRAAREPSLSAPLREYDNTRPLWPPPMISASRRPGCPIALFHDSILARARAAAAFGNQTSHPPPKARRQTSPHSTAHRGTARAHPPQRSISACPRGSRGDDRQSDSGAARISADPGHMGFAIIVSVGEGQKLHDRSGPDRCRKPGWHSLQYVTAASAPPADIDFGQLR